MKKKPGRPKKLANKKVETPKIEIKKEENATTEPSAVHVDADKQAPDVPKVEESVSESPLQESPKEEKEDKVESGTPIQEIKLEEVEVKSGEEDEVCILLSLEDVKFSHCTPLTCHFIFFLFLTNDHRATRFCHIFLLCR